MPGPKIRRARPSDAALVAGIHVRGWQWGYRGILPDGVLADLSASKREARWRTQLAADSEAATWIAEEGGRASGFVSCGPTRDLDAPARTGEVYAIYLEEDAQGTGTGRALMQHAVEDLRARGFRVATLWVLENNPRARRFYEIGGWALDGARKIERAPEGERREVRYRIDLK